MRVLLATTNHGKLLELKEIMSDLGVEVVGLREPAETEGIETGLTFAENALLKARYYHGLFAVPVIADDSAGRRGFTRPVMPARTRAMPTAFEDCSLR